jgi:hypothetical protein
MNSNCDENVQASFSIPDCHPQQLIHKLSQPILQAVGKTHSNIFVDQAQVSGNHITPEQNSRRLVSGYGVEDTVMRGGKESNKLALESVQMYKQLYQSCDLQADTIDSTCLHSQPQNIFKKQAERY